MKKPMIRRHLELWSWLAIVILSPLLAMSYVATHTIADTTVIHERVLLATDVQITNLFIDQLLTPKSAKCFRAILVKESNMRPAALNKKSGAKGMGQLLDSTYRNLGLRHSKDPLAQSVAALSYIGRHFGGADATCKAWAYWKKNKSY